MPVPFLRLFSEVLLLLLVGGFWYGTHRAEQYEAQRRGEAAKLYRASLLLDDLVRAELAFREANVVDEDHDGKGEFAFASELLGERPPRGQTECVKTFAIEGLTLHARTGFVDAGDYFLTVYLPGRGGEGAILDPSILGAYGPDLVNPDEAETTLIACAWPRRGDWKVFVPPPTFVATAARQIYWCAPRVPYVGRRRPAPAAAWPPDLPWDASPGGVGRDGERWFDLEDAQPIARQ
ncbi:MAG: hypothetical protein AB1486_14755 [Planctomycetota bacterium]